MREDCKVRMLLCQRKKQARLMCSWDVCWTKKEGSCSPAIWLFEKNKSEKKEVWTEEYESGMSKTNGEGEW